MNRRKKLVTFSAIAGLFLSLVTANAEVWIDPVHEPNVDIYCPSSGTPQECPYVEISRACGTIHLYGRSYTYCCQQITNKCIGNSNTWTEASAQSHFAEKCVGTSCEDQATGEDDNDDQETPVEP